DHRRGTADTAAHGSGRWPGTGSTSDAAASRECTVRMTNEARTTAVRLAGPDTESNTAVVGVRHQPSVVHGAAIAVPTYPALIAVCDNAHESLPAEQPRLHWLVPDPARADTDDAFEAACTELADRIDRLTPAVRHGSPTMTD